MSSMRRFVFDADDEEPLCERCDNFSGPEEFCCQECGADNWWNGYKRSIYVEAYTWRLDVEAGE